MTRQSTLTRVTLQHWLDRASWGEQSAVLAEASQALGSLEAVYALLDSNRSKEAR
jgi:hypothetical protein